MTQTDKMVTDDVETTKLRLDLGELDREWMEERERHVPAEGMTVFGVVVFGVAGLLSLVAGVVTVTRRPELAVLFILLGVFFTGGSLLELKRIFRRNEAYNRAKQNYEARRREILREIEAVRDSAIAEKENDESRE